MLALPRFLAKQYDYSGVYTWQIYETSGLGPVDTPVITKVANQPLPAPSGSVAVVAAGSVAAFVSAGRALSGQLADAQGAAVVRERYWLTFQPGEVCVCGSCHGLSELDQAGHSAPQNMPQALVELLTRWTEGKRVTPGSAIYLPAVNR